MGNVRSSGLVAPRYTGAPVSTSGLRPTKALVGAQTSASAEGIRKPGGIPVPTFRTQTRIPAPGQLRFRLVYWLRLFKSTIDNLW